MDSGKGRWVGIGLRKLGWIGFLADRGRGKLLQGDNIWRGNIIYFLFEKQMEIHEGIEGTRDPCGLIF